jgi:hypothetical protein
MCASDRVECQGKNVFNSRPQAEISFASKVDFIVYYAKILKTEGK